MKKGMPSNIPKSTHKVSFVKLPENDYTKDPNQPFLKMIEETEKNYHYKKSYSANDSKKSVFGYYHRLFTHYSIRYGTQKLREAKASDQGAMSIIFGQSQMNIT